MRQVARVAGDNKLDFKKPLKVVFEGEEGIDEGGVQKEFFLVLVRQLLDPNYAMCRFDPDSHLMWFNT